MLPLFDKFRNMTISSMVLSMLLAVVCGGLIGIEREYKRRPAGFRTHILICLGSTMTTLVSRYLVFVLGYYTDIARLGAQVVAGIGFIGAGTIVVTRRQRIKGLTTAAGLWTVGIVGLALGAGFYEGGIIATLLVLIAELIFSKLEYRILAHVPELNILMEYEMRDALEEVIKLCRARQVKIVHLEITRQASGHGNAYAIFTLHLNKQDSKEKLLKAIRVVEGVSRVDEI
jgi:putative Mg2+ transporter-C (MgtC) family protein